MASRHFIVTGGGSGVGAAIALALAAAGARVSVLGRREAPLQDVARRGGAGVFWHGCDVTLPEQIQAAYAAARDHHGAIHGVIANAGAADSQPFSRMTPEDLQAALAVNLTGVFACWQAALEDMRGAGWGRLIAVASTAGLKGYPYVSGYVAAKHAVVGLTRALALELARTGITVNAVCPGFVDTPLLDRSLDRIMEKTGGSRASAEAALRRNNPQDRFVRPEEVAEAVLYLCRDAAGGINGAALPISGGEI